MVVCNQYTTLRVSQYIFSSDDRLKKRKRPSDEGIEYPQVLLAIRLDKHELDLDAWKECLLRQIPTEAKDIKIEGIFSSFSTLLLLRLPVAVWDLLSGNLAYSFIGFVTSENKAIAASPGCSSASTSVDAKTQSSGEVGLGQTNDHFSTTPIDPNLLPPYNNSMMISNSASPSYDIEDSQPDEMSEYSNYQPSEFSDIEDPFFGVNFDAGVQRLNSIFGLQGVTSQTAQPLEKEPDPINLMATSSVNPADSNSLNSPKIASPRNVLSPPASTRSSSPSRDPPFSPYLTSVSSPPPLSTGQAINSRNNCLNTFRLRCRQVGPPYYSHDSSLKTSGLSLQGCKSRCETSCLEPLDSFRSTAFNPRPTFFRKFPCATRSSTFKKSLNSILFEFKKHRSNSSRINKR